jgi:FkbM family methyltransferase
MNKAFNFFRYIYKTGIFKSIFIYIACFAASSEYEFEWKSRQIHVRKKTSDLNVFRQIFALEQYKNRSLEGMKIESIVDLGANIGLSALYYKMTFPGAKVLAVEPEIGNYNMMLKNLQGLDNVHCLNNAIWNSSKSLGVYDRGLGEYGFIVSEENPKEIGSIKSLTIDEIMENYNLSKIDLLKIDIEGSEKELFALNFESWLPKVGCIVIELHDWMRSGCASSFFKAISPYNYDVSFKGENLTVVFDGKNEFTKPRILSRKALRYNQS